MGLVTPTRAIVRRPSQCYAACLRHDPRPIDVALAQQQHAGYVQALREAGVVVEELAELDSPDACFVEDTAVVLGDRALVTRPGAPSRRGEIDTIAAALEQRVTVVRMTAPATLDGGDVLRCEGALVVGLSTRTNREGLAQLGAVAGAIGLRVVGVEVGAGLHLKSACTLADANTLLVQPGVLAPDALGELELELVEVPEPEGANVLAFT
ncbi:MAG: hypothetical protein IAG13_26885, partial [Deltaproteobacteria bacterium]|nr:hypothetical protein [Nannocystaceae bacterium]